MKAILVIDLEHPNENIDIEGTQATYIELKTIKGIRRISLINHWLKPIPDKIDQGYPCDKYEEGYGDGWDSCLDEILGEEI